MKYPPTKTWRCKNPFWNMKSFLLERVPLQFLVGKNKVTMENAPRAVKIRPTLLYLAQTFAVNGETRSTSWLFGQLTALGPGYCVVLILCMGDMDVSIFRSGCLFGFPLQQQQRCPQTKTSHPRAKCRSLYATRLRQAEADKAPGVLEAPGDHPLSRRRVGEPENIVASRQINMEPKKPSKKSSFWDGLFGFQVNLRKCRLLVSF